MRGDPSRSEDLIARELLANGRLFVTELSELTDLPTWKVSRALKRLEIRGQVCCEVEDRRDRGRPRKFYELMAQAREVLANGGVKIV